MKRMMSMVLLLVFLVGCGIGGSKHDPADLIAVREDGLEGYVNGEGEWAIKPKFESANDFSIDDGLALVRKAESRELVYIDTSGREVFSTKDIETNDLSVSTYRGFSEGLAPLLDLGNVYYMNTDGELVLEIENIERFNFSEDPGYRFHDGLAVFGALTEDAEWGETEFGYYDTNGEVVIESTYSTAGNFGEGLAFVGNYYDENFKTVRDFHYIDKDENKIFDLEVEQSGPVMGYPFKNGYSMVKYLDTMSASPSFFFIDKEGNRAGPGDVAEAYGYEPIIASYETDVPSNGGEYTTNAYMNTKGEFIPIIVDGEELDYYNDINYIRSFGDRKMAKFSYDDGDGSRIGVINIDGDVIWLEEK